MVQDPEKNVIITPCSDEEMFLKRFLDENVWFHVRVAASKIEQLQYIAIYRSAPVSAITHYAKIKTGDQKPTLYGRFPNKYIFHVEDVKTLKYPIVQDVDSNLNFQSAMYVSLDKLLSSEIISQLKKD